MLEIIAGKRIDTFEISMSIDILLERIKDIGIENVDKKSIHQAMLVTCLPYRFWIDDDSKKITQITVSAGYEGKFLKTIGIGSTMRDVQSIAGDYYEDEDVYKLKNHKGICFELGDTNEDDSWDELDAPIEYISIYSEN